MIEKQKLALSRRAFRNKNNQTMFLNSTTPLATHFQNTTLTPITTYFWFESPLSSPTSDVIALQQEDISSLTVVIQESSVTSITTLRTISGTSTSINSLFTTLSGIPSSKSNTVTSISIPVPSDGYRYTSPTPHPITFTFPTRAPNSSTSSPITEIVTTDATFTSTAYASQVFVTVYTTIDGGPVYPISTSTQNFGNSSSTANNLANPQSKLTKRQEVGIGVGILFAVTFIALVWFISRCRHKERRDQPSQERDLPIISYPFRKNALKSNHTSNSLERPRFELITPHTDRPNYFPRPGSEGSAHNRESLDEDGYRWPKPTVLTGDSKMFHEWTKRAQRDYQQRMKLRGGGFGGTGMVWGKEDACDE